MFDGAHCSPSRGDIQAAGDPVDLRLPIQVDQRGFRSSSLVSRTSRQKESQVSRMLCSFSFSSFFASGCEISKALYPAGSDKAVQVIQPFLALFQLIGVGMQVQGYPGLPAERCASSSALFCFQPWSFRKPV